VPGSAANMDASLSARTAADSVPDGLHAVAGLAAFAGTSGRPLSVAPPWPSPHIAPSNTGSDRHSDGTTRTRPHTEGTDGRPDPRGGSDRRTGLLRRPMRSRTLSVRPVSYGDTLEGSELRTPGPRSIRGTAASRSTPPRVATSRNPPRSPALDQLAWPRFGTIVSSFGGSWCRNSVRTVR
jgi:hypothetical protein